MVGFAFSFPLRSKPFVDDGHALFEAVCAHELEGIVAKRKTSRYRPNDRGWIKVKNRDYWHYELERESAISKRRERVFV
jgi:ATP-dependent DNA ligase